MNATAMIGRMETELIGECEAIVGLRKEADRVARSDAKVLITGESGVGKEVVARHIHASGPRASKRFTAVNCAAVPESLLESELFGHVKGSFTGAYRDRPGHLEVAHHGTLFLDEIGEMSPRMQGLLLRFLETGELQAVGADPRRGHHVDVRVISATNRNLLDLVEERTFRADLFYRVNVVHLKVPPLRQRREDIPVLVRHFLDLHGARRQSPALRMSDAAMTALVAYSWPGNVRELENVIERLMVGAPGPVIDVEHLPNEIRVGDPVTLRQKCDRRRAVAYDLYRLMRDQHQSFWSTIHPLFVKHDITRATVRDVVRLGLEDARGNYRILARLFNLEPKEYRGFRNFLREYDCDIPLNAGSRSAWSGRRPGGDGSSASHADVEVAG